MSIEIVSLYFEAHKDSGVGEESHEKSPRDLQREGVLREQGEEGLAQLEEFYNEFDARAERERKKGE
ncbi:hypothetical protein A2V80_03550 [Candidatus Woesebacteria bacterium RBG_16_39_8b]|uniref:Uncharacterized protein n=1 Tax=Candidatus Woesebacteria bacterium RBG_16_39_8b TaxID=1802482 RepID=A0A1F7XC82_9BACT|nr:MAG: hypothetical protein A2V80_03550 [Candidatus Woesebacteria bacterium RBG_16_39_8b]